MRSPFRLSFIDGDFTLVFPPTVLGDNHQFHARQIREYHYELMRAIASCKDVWGFNDEELRAIANSLYVEFGIYYNKIGSLFQPVIPMAKVAWRCRHEFLIATEPIKHPATGDLVRGLSGLEQLMGFSYAVPTESSEAITQVTTGDTELDILTDAILIFKDQGLPLARLLSAEALALAAKQAGDRMKPPDEADSTPTAEPPIQDDDVFLEMKGAIAQKLEAIGVTLPRTF